MSDHILPLKQTSPELGEEVRRYPMPRYSSDGKAIFPANEVGEFTVCPEAWRLKRLEKEPILPSSRTDEGNDLHDRWAKAVEYEFSLGRLIRLLAALLMSATILLLLMNQ
ncbi:hypothetical protein MRY87_12090 [bacterium]|nr:hypothetical protein [bacterium]